MTNILEHRVFRHEQWIKGEIGGEQLVLEHEFFADKNLSSTNLSQAVLRNCVFIGCNFNYTYMYAIDSTGTRFINCTFEGVHPDVLETFSIHPVAAFPHEDNLMHQVRQHYAWLQSGVIGQPLLLRNQTLFDKNLSHLDLSHARFLDCELEGVDFRGANLTGADFTGSTLTTCNFEGAIMTDVKGLSRADTTKADTSKADTSKASVAKRDNSGKVPLAYLPLDLLHGAARVMEFGAKKYDLGNYRKGYADLLSPMNSLLRHVDALRLAVEQYESGDAEVNFADQDSGFNHVDHVITSALLLIQTMKIKGVYEQPKGVSE